MKKHAKNKKSTKLAESKSMPSTVESKDIEMKESKPKEEIVVAGPCEFSEEDIADFQKECGKKPQFSIDDFNESLIKHPDELSYKDNRVLISKAGWLNDDERKKFKKVFKLENLTKQEEERYRKIYPNPIRFNALFPTQTK